MKKITGLLLLVIIIHSCTAQYKVQKAQAFFTATLPGMAMQDEQGNTIDPQPVIERFIYLECRFNGKPVIDSVLYNGILFIPSVAGKETTTARIGINATTGKAVNLLPKKGNLVWRIGLQQMNGNTLMPGAIKKILIKGKLGKAKFAYTLNTETKLAAADRY